MSRPEASGSEPVNASTISGPDTATERPLLVEFAELWNRGLAEPDKLWHLFDLCEMYMFKPAEYYGAPVFGINEQLVTPVFSTEQNLTSFMAGLPDPGVLRESEGFDWVLLTGTEFFRLPVRARWLAIDPSGSSDALIDLAAREPQPALAGNTPAMFTNLEMNANGDVIRLTGDVGKARGDSHE